jgi:hypothetical protein
MMKAIDEGLEGLVLKDLKVRKRRLEERTIYLQKEPGVFKIFYELLVLFNREFMSLGKDIG